MKIPNLSFVSLMLLTLGSVLCLGVAAQPPDLDQLTPKERLEVKKNPSIASVSTSRSELSWKLHVPHEGLVLTIALPDGEVIRQEFNEGDSPVFKLLDEKGNALADGTYNYELRLTPKLSDEVKATLREARENGNDAETARAMKKDGLLPDTGLVQHGSFRIEKGVLYTEATDKNTAPRSARSKREVSPSFEPAYHQSAGFRFTPAALARFDQVIPDDLIVQGSACVGLDCVNNEVFGFDTIRLKENNLRIKFDDTSTSAGFPANDWQLTANDSTSGGQNKFSIEDVTGATVPFTVTAGATTNSLFVSNTGRIGLRTATPVLDLHLNTSNTPAQRLEQNNSGGFTAQTWDVGGNEANFFIRDVTGGSRLPFRIRPGAPTSSLDIAASGNVGIGTASPARKMELSANGGNVGMKITDTGISNAAFLLYLRRNGPTLADRQFSILDENVLADRLVINANGFIGIGGLLNPTNPFQHNNGAFLSAGGVWTNASSRTLKTNIHQLNARDAFTALQQLNPVKFQYKAAPGEQHVGFIAEEVPDLVATRDRKGLSSMDVLAVLTKVVKEQQQVIANLKLKVERLEQARAKQTRPAKKR